MTGGTPAPVFGGQHPGAARPPAAAERAIRMVFAVLALIGMAVQIAAAGSIMAARTDRTTYAEDLPYWWPHLAAISTIVLGLGLVAAGLFQRGAGSSAERLWSIAAMATTVVALCLGPAALLLRPLLHSNDLRSAESLVRGLVPVLPLLLTMIAAYLVRRTQREKRLVAVLLAAGATLTVTALATLVLAAVVITVPSTCCPW